MNGEAAVYLLQSYIEARRLAIAFIVDKLERVIIMKQVQDELANLSRDVELMKGSVPDDASLHLLASQQFKEIEYMEDWLGRNGPRHPSQAEVVTLRSHLNRLKVMSERLMGINKQRQGLDDSQSETGINLGTDGETEAKDIPTEDEARNQEVSELIPPAEETEKNVEESQPKGWHQRKVAN